MAKADLTAQRLRELLHYHPETGVFTRRVKRGKWPAGQTVGHKNGHGYVVVGLEYSIFMAHRLAFLYMTGEWPACFIDHVDCDKTNNRWSNLRAANFALNSQNQRFAKTNNKSSGLLGVNWHAQSGKWRAKLKIGDRYVSCGLHETPELAHAAYVEAKRRFHPGCTL